jgi:hypothetical protein
MAQKTNLNVSPYFDDFNSDKNFYKVLFNPGRAIQSRELNTLQSILQNQIESFGSHIFKEGSIVIPGNISYDSKFYAVKLNPSNFNIDIGLYINNFIGKKIKGQVSGITASIQSVAFPNNDEIDYITIYVKYLDSNNDFINSTFTSGEGLVCTENVTYGNTTINAGTIFASLISDNPTFIGSSASINEGIVFVRGSFVKVSKQTLILDYYSNTPSYRVGLRVVEEIITAKDDSSLYDNAKGFTNYAAPGADRFKISLVLTKKPLNEYNTDTDFIELLRVKDGLIQKIETKSDYGIIKDYLAQRTFDESGNYTVVPFTISVNNSLNDRLGNDGLYFDTEETDERNKPNDDLMCIKISPGKAYVRGYDIEKTGTTIIDVKKPRDKQLISGIGLPFEMGNLIRVNNVTGCPTERLTIDLYNRRVDDSGSIKIGDARVYTFNLTDSRYVDDTTTWDLYLYDIQTYVRLTLNNTLSNTELVSTSYIVGKSSGASGYAVSSGNNSQIVNIRQVSGNFIVGEKILINGIEDTSRIIKSIQAFNSSDIKSVYQSGSPAFTADTVLSNTTPYGFNSQDQITITSGGTVTSPNKLFTGISTNSIIKYSISGFSTESYNRVTSVSNDGLSMTVVAIPNVNGVCVGSLPSSQISSRFSLGASSILNEENAYLYCKLPNSNIANVDLSDSNISFSAQSNISPTVSGNTLTVFPGDFNLPSGISTASFQAYDEKRYSIHYTDGTVETLSSDEVTILPTSVRFNGISNKTVHKINASFIKQGIQSKLKTYSRSKIIGVSLSKYQSSGTGISTSIYDGLNYNPYYGLRVQDEEICLNYPDVVKVLAVYESLDVNEPILDSISFSATVNVLSNAIIGENIVGKESNTVARVVRKPNEYPNNLEIVYLNSNRFSKNELVTFGESNIEAEIDSIIFGKYKDITNSFKLDKGQRDQYYDYSRLIRNRGESEPSRRLLIVFDHYEVSGSDNGDAFTVLSYNSDRFLKDIPNIGLAQVRGTDTLDFRPRVTTFSGSESSPFDFSSRNFSTAPRTILKPNESSIVTYEYYLPRIDKLYLDKFGGLIVDRGVSSPNPKEPIKDENVLELASIYLPPYLYSPKDAKINLVDNRRYTMKDIGKIEDRVENLEKVTSLSLLELNTQSLQIRDADGFNRFKTGFFVDDFKTTNFIDLNVSLSEVNRNTNQLTPLISRNSLKSQLTPASNVSISNLDLSTNYELLDNRVQKTGRVVTLKYTEVDWIEQPFATRVENVNPFHVINYAGQVTLNPARDNWIRTIQLPNRILTHNNTLNLQIRTETNRVNLQNIDNRSSAGTNLTGRQVTVADTFTTLSSNTQTTTRTTRSSDTSTSETSETAFITSENETFIRSRNTEFVASNLKPYTRFYQFFDGSSAVDFIPKLIEISSDLDLINYGSIGSFQVGETVFGYFNNQNIIRFRVARPDHKFGPFNNPSTKYDVNPYFRDEALSTSYSSSSKILNVDTFSLCEEAQGRFSGYILPTTVLIGSTSQAVAYVKDIRLISDNYGDLIGSFFIRDPNTTPPPAIRITTGNKTFKITSSQTNESQQLGSTDISSAQTNYLSEGTVQMYQDIIRRNTVSANLDHFETINTTTITATTQTAVSQFNLPPEEVNFITEITNNITNVTNVTNNNITNIIQQQAERVDPLAQTFVVGANIDAPSNQTFTEDVNGAHITAVDLYFRKKDPGNSPVTVQIRTVELGTPTLTVLGNSVTLRPNQVNVSEDGLTPTRFEFDYPILLPPGREYAIVILAPESDQYEVWIAEMGEKTVSTAFLPDSESVRYTTQFAIGSLFKSQNGSIWTANQYQDLKFKLHKAIFTSSSGVVFFQNPVLDRSNGYIRRLINNPITSYPRKINVGVTTITDSSLINILKPGRKVGENFKTYNYGYIVGTGCSVSSLEVTDGGKNYVTDSLVSTYNITGNGSGLTLNITASNGVIIGTPTIVSYGNGYAIGDVVGIVTSTVSSNTGEGAKITITGNNNGIDTLYLTNVQGDTFNDGTRLVYYDNSNNRITLGSTYIRGDSTPVGGIYAGNVVKVDHFDHGMYADNNKISISDVESNVAPVTLSTELGITDTIINVSTADTTNFGTFEGGPVSALNPGYLKINNEIIKYTSVTSSSIEGLTRGQNSTIPIKHSVNSLLYKYELNGISLRRINTTHDISDISSDIDSYYLEIDLQNNGPDRRYDGLIDGNGGNYPRAGFNLESSGGGINAYASENIIYNSIMPMYQIINPGSATNVSAQIRTVSGTSVNGNEISFQDQGYEDVKLNSENLLSSTRIVCSEVNEAEFLSAMPNNKSFITAITLNTRNYNISPMIMLDTSFTEFVSARLNKPIEDYINDNRVNSLTDDPHSAIYVSNTVRLSQPSNTLKVFISAYKHSSADFRVLYSLLRPNSSEIDQSYELFPGYQNLTIDNNQDGYLDVIDVNKNNGLPDIFVPDSLENQFLEYQYTATDIGPFTGFKIKIVMSGTDQANYPRFKDIRTIALA